MDTHLLEELVCPFCNGELSRSFISSAEGDEILYGTLSCDCRTYPVVEGIAVIKKDMHLEEVCDHILAGRHKKALLILLEIVPIHNRYLNHLVSDIARFLPGSCLDDFISKMQEKHVLLDERRCTFDYSSLLWQWEWGEEGFFFEHRFSTTGFLSFLPYCAEIYSRSGRILDLCSGVGHALFLLSKQISEDLLFAIDIDFKKLFISREIFARNSHYFCCDANLPLPFKSNFFSTILCSDAFHYIDAKSGLAREMERLLQHRGLIYVVHLHNSLKNNPYPGNPLTPGGYQKLFSKLNVKLLPEGFILKNFLENNELLLDSRVNTESLNHHSVLHLVAGDDGTAHSNFENVWESLLPVMSNTILNPLYSVIDWAENIHVKKTFPSSFFAHEQSFVGELLSDELFLPAGLLEGDDSSLDSMKEELIKKFVLIEVPKRYGSRHSIHRRKPDARGGGKVL